MNLSIRPQRIPPSFLACDELGPEVIPRRLGCGIRAVGRGLLARYHVANLCGAARNTLEKFSTKTPVVCWLTVARIWPLM